MKRITIVSCLVLILVAAVMSGCATTDPARWAAVPTPAVEAAVWHCKNYAQDQQWRMNVFGGALVPLIGLFQYAGNFDGCMNAHGYEKGESRHE